MAAYEIPVILDGKKVGTAGLRSDGTIEADIHDPATAEQIHRGQIIGLSIRPTGRGKIELV